MLYYRVNTHFSDGCPEERTFLNENYNIYVTWPESDIGSDPIITSCPCGELNSTRYGNPNLTRVCGGSYTYGAEWEVFDASGCNYTENTYKLCSVTQVRITRGYIPIRLKISVCTRCLYTH